MRWRWLEHAASLAAATIAAADVDRHGIRVTRAAWVSWSSTECRKADLRFYVLRCRAVGVGGNAVGADGVRIRATVRRDRGKRPIVLSQVAGPIKVGPPAVDPGNNMDLVARPCGRGCVTHVRHGHHPANAPVPARAVGGLRDGQAQVVIRILNSESGAHAVVGPVAVAVEVSAHPHRVVIGLTAIRR